MARIKTMAEMVHISLMLPDNKVTSIRCWRIKEFAAPAPIIAKPAAIAMMNLNLNGATTPTSFRHKGDLNSPFLKSGPGANVIMYPLHRSRNFSAGHEESSPNAGSITRTLLELIAVTTIKCNMPSSFLIWAIYGVSIFIIPTSSFCGDFRAFPLSPRLLAPSSIPFIVVPSLEHPQRLLALERGITSPCQAAIEHKEAAPQSYRSCCLMQIFRFVNPSHIICTYQIVANMESGGKMPQQNIQNHPFYYR